MRPYAAFTRILTALALLQQAIAADAQRVAVRARTGPVIAAVQARFAVQPLSLGSVTPARQTFAPAHAPTLGIERGQISWSALQSSPLLVVAASPARALPQPAPVATAVAVLEEAAPRVDAQPPAEPAVAAAHDAQARTSPEGYRAGWLQRRVAETVRDWTESRAPVFAMMEGFSERPPARLKRAAPESQRPGRRVVPGPSVLPARLGIAAGWAALVVAAGALNIPSDAVWPVAAALVGGPILAWMTARSVYARRGNAMQAPELRPISGDEQEWIARDARLLAQQSGLAMPEIQPHPFKLAQAAVDGTPSAWTMHYFGGLLDMPAEQRRAVIAHEVGHIAHYDRNWMMAQVTLAGVVPALALAAGMSDPWLALLALPLGAASVLLLAAFLRLAEFQADRRSAWALGSGGPLANAYRTAFQENLAPARRASASDGPWARLMRFLAALVAGHPSPDARIRALERLDARAASGNP